MINEDSLSFQAEWYDKLACINKPFKILFYLSDNSIEIIDIKNKRQFLKRIQNESIKADDLFIGNQLEIYGRRFTIVDYGDQQTKNL